MSSGFPTIVIPWKYVLHDNHRLMPVVQRQKAGKVRARLIQAPEYRDAKAAAELHIKRQWRGLVRLNGALTLTARCFFPDNRKRDAGNYRKLCTDAMSGICYGDDAQLESETWQKAGLDRENPRVEISVRAITEE